jgi:hypothetical protein
VFSDFKTKKDSFKVPFECLDAEGDRKYFFVNEKISDIILKTIDYEYVGE